jgi:hypothetical protein
MSPTFRRGSTIAPPGVMALLHDIAFSLRDQRPELEQSPFD